MISSMDENNAGYNGFEFISDIAAHAPSVGQVFTELYTITATVFATLSSEAALTGNTFTGVSIPANSIIKGQFALVTLTSGSLIAYKGI